MTLLEQLTRELEKSYDSARAMKERVSDKFLYNCVRLQNLVPQYAMETGPTHYGRELTDVIYFGKGDVKKSFSGNIDEINDTKNKKMNLKERIGAGLIGSVSVGCSLICAGIAGFLFYFTIEKSREILSWTDNYKVLPLMVVCGLYGGLGGLSGAASIVIGN